MADNKEVVLTQSEKELAAVTKFANENANNLPPEFKTPDDFVKSYQALQSEFTKKSQRLAELEKEKPLFTETPAEKKADPLTSLKVEDKKVEENTPLFDYDLLQKEYVENNGAISETTKDNLIKKGVPPQVINDVLDAVKMKIQTQVTEASKLVGSEDELKAILAYVKETYSPEDKASVNAALQSKMWRETLLGLKARLDAKKATNEPKRTPGVVNAQASGGEQPWSNEREMIAAMRDPRYKNRTDSAFTESVMKRTRATQKNGGYSDSN